MKATLTGRRVLSWAEEEAELLLVEFIVYDDRSSRVSKCRVMCLVVYDIAGL